MPPETQLWRIARMSLRPYGLMQRIETTTGSGVPDVSYAFSTKSRYGNGWIELKHVPRWPARDDSPLRIRNLSVHQVRWLRRWRETGGLSFLLMRVGDDFILLDGVKAGAVMAGKNIAWYADAALVFQTKKFPTLEILRALCPYPRGER